MIDDERRLRLALLPRDSDVVSVRPQRVCERRDVVFVFVYLKPNADSICFSPSWVEFLYRRHELLYSVVVLDLWKLDQLRFDIKRFPSHQPLFDLYTDWGLLQRLELLDQELGAIQLRRFHTLLQRSEDLIRRIQISEVCSNWSSRGI